jgi:hypothetical protein
MALCERHTHPATALSGKRTRVNHCVEFDALRGAVDEALRFATTHDNLA